MTHHHTVIMKKLCLFFLCFMLCMSAGKNEIQIERKVETFSGCCKKSEAPSLQLFNKCFFRRKLLQ